MATAYREVIIQSPYAPRRAFLPFHERQKRWAVMVCHRRAGKTVACINDLIRGAAQAAGQKKQSPRFAYVAPFFRQAKEVAWDYLKRYTDCVPGRLWHEAELRTDLPGDARIRLYGADNPDRLRGIYLDGVVLDEYGDMDPRVWSQVIRPALADRGGWAVFIGTPRGQNHFAELWDAAKLDDEYFGFMLKASESGILSAGELESYRKQSTKEEYEAEFECSFTAGTRGVFYGNEIDQAEREGRITKVPHEPKAPCFTCWDLGFDDATAIWVFQLVGKEIRFIDYFEDSGQPLAYYANWIRNRPSNWVWGQHYLPHDVEVRELGTGESRLETLRSLGMLNASVVRLQRVEDGIQAVRNIFPRAWFDRDKCERGLRALKNYRREFDDQRKVLKSTALHDWASHSADALRYGALSVHSAAAADKQDKIKYPNMGIV